MKTAPSTCVGMFRAFVALATIAGLIVGWVDRQCGGHLQTALVGAVLMFAGSAFLGGLTLTEIAEDTRAIVQNERLPKIVHNNYHHRFPF